MVVAKSSTATTLKKEIGNRLREGRQALGLTQKQLCMEIGMPLPSLRDYELGNSIPGGEAIASIVRAGISANYVLSGQLPILWSEQLEMAKASRGAPDVPLDDFRRAIVFHALSQVRRSDFVLAATEPGHRLNQVIDDYNSRRIFQDDTAMRESIPELAIGDLIQWGRAVLNSEDRAKYVVTPLDQGGKRYVSIPLFNSIRAAAGHGAVVDFEKPDDALMFKEDWIRYELGASPQDLCLIRVTGDSMEPTLRAGDIILIDHRTSRPDREGIYIIRMGDMLLVKRVQAIPGGKIRVISDNSAFDSWTIDLADIGNEVAIVGRVVWSGRRL